MSDAMPKNTPLLKYPVIVEGRYDKAAILGMMRGTVITTEGFGIFNNSEKRALIKRLCSDKVILLTDSDGGGRQIRSFISGILPKEAVINLYIPELAGKERRKTKRSKAGLLGVEGVGGDMLRDLLLPYTDEGCERTVGGVTAADFYRDALTGSDMSSSLRDRLCLELGLPSGMSAKALLSAVNLLISAEEYCSLVSKIQSERQLR